MKKIVCDIDLNAVSRKSTILELLFVLSHSRALISFIVKDMVSLMGERRILMDWDDYYNDDDDRSYALRDFAKLSYSDDPYDIDRGGGYSDFGFDSYDEQEESDDEWW